MPGRGLSAADCAANIAKLPRGVARQMNLLQRACYHEAGHCAAALAYGIPLSALIWPTIKWRGTISRADSVRCRLEPRSPACATALSGWCARHGHGSAFG